jgi:hypothetical protein
MRFLLYKKILALFLFTPFLLKGNERESSLFTDLETIERINKEIKDELPLFYNYSFVGGYFTMPSARMAKSGTIAAGAARLPPYNNYGLNFQVFDHLEISGNYRIFKGITEQNFGNQGFGDDAERIGNFKFALLLPEDGYSMLPAIVLGAEDFVGTRRFHAKYAVITKSFLGANLELSFGWGKGRIKGPFGGGAWSPFRHQKSFLKNFSILAEYDAVNYKKHAHEHPKGRRVASRINVGASYLAWDALQLSFSSLRGREIAASASLRYPLGTSLGLFPKVQDAVPYCSPIDTEPLGPLRSQKQLAHELAYAFSDQGLDLFTVYLLYTPDRKKMLYLKVVNNRYREEKVVRDRIEHLLSALIPSDVDLIRVVIESDAIATQSYLYRREDLVNYRTGVIGKFELETLSPMEEPVRKPGIYDSTPLFHRRKEVWSLTFCPRLLTFFGSAKGKLKYSLGLTASPEGYLFDQVYYKFLFSYAIKSSLAGLGQQDALNPSYLINVRTDTLRYYQTNSVSMEEAFLQKGWNIIPGIYGRVATGYFEPAYGGFAGELLYFPVQSCFAVGVEAATVWKRHYKGVAFTGKIRKLLKDGTVTHVPFLGQQYFVDLYYDFKPLHLEFKATAGQFLAKDLGVRVEAARYFPSGLRFSIWYTYTSARDIVNGRKYHDQGFAFYIPFDMFLRQSSRTYLGYAMSVWLRDQGAQAATGKPLYWTLKEARYNY